MPDTPPTASTLRALQARAAALSARSQVFAAARLVELGDWLRVLPWLRLARAGVLFGTGFLVGLVGPYGIFLDTVVAARFEQFSAQPSRVYARSLRLAPGERLDAASFELELKAARYQAAVPPLKAGTYRRKGERFELVTRAFNSAQGAVAEQSIAVELRGSRIAKVVDAVSAKPIALALLDPARIATLYGPNQKEQRNVPITEVPALLSATLKAVEDQHFDHHIGLDFGAIARAFWVNTRSGEVVQGGSTLTQQLARHLFLNRRQNLERKVREAVLTLVIERRYSKAQILEAYLNEVYLGQQGAQAVHGVAAAAEFYFGHDLSALSVAETALLVGMIKGPSLYEPRRRPKVAQARRAVVLNVMLESGLIDKAQHASALKAPLGIKDSAPLARNRYPAFLDLVREQLQQQFPDSALRTQGLNIHTTLSPSAQILAERAVVERLKALGKPAAALQAALVLTDTRNGAIEAVVGGRDPNVQGFNRALLARRPIGSLVKPFVYLLALAQPQRWSLMSPLDDSAISLKLPNGTTWKPANNDRREHGQVPLIDALARSYNLASVRLGLEVEVAKVRTLLQALVPGLEVAPNPSLLLGAVELSPLQVAQAYQYLAADGRPLALYAVDSVLDLEGKPLSRQPVVPAPNAAFAAVRLLGFALQETAKTGSAQDLSKLGLGHLKVAGKTGTSNDQRDSWFAGYTGRHLAIVWLGTDDNSQTSYYGATGAMRVWAGLFAKLPSEPLDLKLEQQADLELAHVDLMQQMQLQAGCPDVRQLPFVAGFAPAMQTDCGWNNDPWRAETQPTDYQSEVAAESEPWSDEWAANERNARESPDRTAQQSYRDQRELRMQQRRARQQVQREAFEREQSMEREQAERGLWYSDEQAMQQRYEPEPEFQRDRDRDRGREQSERGDWFRDDPDVDQRGNRGGRGQGRNRNKNRDR